jgi:DNA-binding CsgD family transcriptional regulator
MQALTGGLTAVSLNCLQLLLWHIRQLPSVRRVRPTDLLLAESEDTRCDDDVAVRVTVGSQVSWAARNMLAALDNHRFDSGPRVRVIRTGRRVRARVPRPRGEQIAVREVSVHLPLLVVRPSVAVLEDLPAMGEADWLVVVRDHEYLESLVACHDLMWSLAAVDGQPQTARLPGHLEALLRELATGSADAQVARNLNISHRTVSRHMAELLDYLGARSRLEAGMLAVRHGLV